eukprot:gene6166-12495_t
MLSKFTQWATHPNKKRVYTFSEGTLEDRNLLGIKGSNLCEMTRMGLPVPIGFIITAETCPEFYHSNKSLPETLSHEYRKVVHDLERKTGYVFGNLDTRQFPLLLSVRCATSQVVPGLMETILNLGINDEITAALAAVTNNPRFAYDTQRRFLQFFGSYVIGIDSNRYTEAIDFVLKKKGKNDISELEVEDLKEIIKDFKTISPTIDDVWEQLRMAIEAGFSSWFSTTPHKYRQLHSISDDIGTAIIIQSMVYGNLNDRSGAGIAFTRNPCTGGEEVIGAKRNSMRIEDLEDLKKSLPQVFDQLLVVQNKLEKAHRDMQDIEFTVESGKLYILESRPGKRTAKASVRIAVEMVEEGIITEREALIRIDAAKMAFFQKPSVHEEAAKGSKICSATAGSASCVCGIAVFDKKEAEKRIQNGESVILIVDDTSAEDMELLYNVAGIITFKGGVTSHAAVTRRSFGKCAITGVGRMCKDAVLDAPNGTMSCCKVHTIRAGEIITLDGCRGGVYKGTVPMVPECEQDDNYGKIMEWADKYKRMHVLASIETVDDVLKAVEYGTEGIGMCKDKKTELMSKLHLLHKQDLFEIFKLFPDKHVCIRLLDAPLTDFFPTT